MLERRTELVRGVGVDGSEKLASLLLGEGTDDQRFNGGGRRLELEVASQLLLTVCGS